MTHRVLFVDDDLNVLQGLQRMLRTLRAEWEMEFASGGAEALRLLAERDFDVVLSDMRMPGMNGAELLREVAERCPRAVRMTLSGQSDLDMTLESVGPAHRALMKPCDRETLQTTVSRVCTLRALVHDEDRCARAIRLRSLPCRSASVQALDEALAVRRPSMEQVTEIVSGDVAMTAKTLHLTNTAFFGSPRAFTRPGQALRQVGLETLQRLRQIGALGFVASRPQIDGLLVGLNRHSFAVAEVARRIAEMEGHPEPMADECWLAGVLHDAGLFAMLDGEELPGGLRDDSVTSSVGALTLGLWGFRDGVVEAAWYHHAPSLTEPAGFTPLIAVHVADQIIEAREHGKPLTFDGVALERAGVMSRLPEWIEGTEAVAMKGDSR